MRVKAVISCRLYPPTHSFYTLKNDHYNEAIFLTNLNLSTVDNSHNEFLTFQSVKAISSLVTEVSYAESEGSVRFEEGKKVKLSYTVKVNTPRNNLKNFQNLDRVDKNL